MPIANTTIRIKKSVVSGNIPSTLANGEIAINSADGKLYYATPSGSIAHLTNSQSFATINANSSLILATSPTDTLSIAAGNNISITTNTTTKTITINSTDSGGLTIDAIARTTANSAFDKANSANILAQSAYSSSNTVNVYAFSAYSTANSAQSNTIALQGISTTQNTWISSNATFTQSAFNQANTANNTANIAATNITVLQSVNTVQNTTIGAAFDKANSANILAQSAFNQANTANTRAYSTVLKTGDTMTGQLTISNTNISTNITTGALIVSGGVGIAGNTWSSGKLSLGNSLSHVNLGNVLNTAATSGVSTYRAINLIDTVAAVKIARLGNNPSIELQEWDNNITNLSSYWDIVSATNGTFQIRDRITGTSKAYLSIFQANGSVYLLSNTISTNTSTGSLILGGGLGANGNIYATAVYSNNALVLTSEPIGQGAFTFANTVNTYAYSANTFLQANDASTLNTSQTYTNTTNTAMKAYVDQANTGMASYVLSSNNAVTAYVTAANTAMKAYVDQANTGLKSYTDATHYAKTGGTISGSVSITTDLTVSGNLFVNGTTTTINTSSIVVNDPLIFLGNNNTISDTVDIGIIGHYNATQNAHTGIFRDANLKEWIFFQNYTPEIRANNLINISDPSFATSNVIASNFKGNLIGNTATVNGIELGSYSQAAFSKANTAASNTVVLQGISTTQNTWISSNAAFTQAAFTQANSANILAQSAYTFANTVNVFTQSAYSKANTSLANTGTVITVNGSSQLVIANTLPSTSNVTGALVVSGGVGIGGNVNVTGTVTTSSPVVISANSTTDALRITQIGTGNALLVEDSSNPDATPFVVDSAGRVGMGGTPSASIPVNIAYNLTGSTSVTNIRAIPSVLSDVTTNAIVFRSNPFTQAAAFTLGGLLHYDAAQGTIGAGSTVVNQYGFNAAASLIGATNNYGFFSSIPSGTGRWNFYANGTADNYFAGNVGIGTTAPTVKLQIGNGTGLQQALISGGGYDLVLGASGGAIFGFSSQNISTVFNTASVPLGVGTNAAQPLIFGTSATERMRLDSSGNLGLGIIPSAWANSRAYQVGAYAAYAQRIPGTADLTVSWNATITSGSSSGTGYVYRNTGDLASAYEQNGTHRWYTAPSGTAGNAISFTQAMTLDANGNFMVGGTTAIGRATVVGGSQQLAFHDGNGGSSNFGLLNYGGTSGELTLNANSSGGNTLIRFLASNGGSNAERMRIGSTGTISLGAAPGSESLRVTPVTSAVNYLNVQGAILNNSPKIRAEGSDTNIGLEFSTKGAAGHSFYSASGGALQFYVYPTASAVNYLQVTGNATTGGPILSAQGSDTNVSINYTGKGTGGHVFSSGNVSNIQFVVSNTTSAVNYVQVSGNVTGSGVSISSNGSDTNIGIGYIAKGSAFHFFYGAGSPQFAIAPTASSVNYLQVTGGATGSGATVSAQGTDTNIAIAYAAKGTGAHVFTGQSGANQFIVASTASAVNYLQITGAVTTGTPYILSTGSDANVNFIASTKGTGVHLFQTSTTALNQFSVGHTASAVNYLQAKGSATGSSLTISALGSDTNIDVQLAPKGTGGVVIGATSASGYKLYVNGSFAAITKSFVIDHPTKPNMKLRYGSLEGPENGVYIRGKLEGDTIQLPEYWTKLVDPDSITVNLTPIGSHQKLYVKDIVDNKVMIGNENLIGKGIKCFYIIFAERNDVEKLQVEIG
jgi:hypothetical protein